MARKMKDSGVEWIGLMPASLKLLKAKYLFSFQKGKLPSSVNNDGVGLPCIGASEMNGAAPTVFTSDDLPTCKETDVLLLWDGANAGLVSSGHVGIVSSTVCRARLVSDSCIPRFAYYSLKNAERYYREKVGGTTIPHMNSAYIDDTFIVAFDLLEQKRIVDFLDAKCAAIDDVIAKTNESIEEYKKLKQAVITEAVTKGVRGKRPMKDSGVDWIGQIPKDWILQKLKYQIDYIESGVSVNAGQSEAEDGQYGVLKTSSVSKQVFDVHENKNVNPEEIERVECPVKANTIIVSRMNTPDLVGACGYVDKDYDNIFLPDRLWQVHFQKKTCVKFVYYWLRSTNVRNYYSSLAVGTSSSMQNISQDQFYHIFCPIFDKDEQREIADYLDSKCAAIDTLISKKQRFIDELTAYKKSLIYEYVTGKKEVPA